MQADDGRPAGAHRVPRLPPTVRSATEADLPSICAVAFATGYFGESARRFIPPASWPGTTPTLGKRPGTSRGCWGGDYRAPIRRGTRPIST